MSRKRKKFYQRKRWRSNSPVATKKDVGWWSGASVKTSEKQAEITRIIKEDGQRLIEEISRNTVGWDTRPEATPLADLQAFAELARKHSIGWEGK